MLQTPLLFLIFNRPEISVRVFKAIRDVRPTTLYIAADGPRSDRTAERKLCEETRQLVLDLIDWPCQVKTLFRAENLGCQQAISEAISWFFSHEEKGIILEDDCLPGQEFFCFCEIMLEKYQDHPEVGMINGVSYFFGQDYSAPSYFFSTYFSIWGWATWRNKWALYQNKLEGWENNRKPTWLTSILKDKNLIYFFTLLFDKMSEGHVDTWDINWVYTLLSHRQLAVTPNKNLISNIGLSGTHSGVHNSRLLNRLLEKFDCSQLLEFSTTVVQDVRLDTIQYANSGLSRFSWRIRGRVISKDLHLLKLLLWLKKR